jgi:hypothetical protein
LLLNREWREKCKARANDTLTISIWPMWRRLCFDIHNGQSSLTRIYIIIIVSFSTASREINTIVSCLTATRKPINFSNIIQNNKRRIYRILLLSLQMWLPEQWKLYVR